jgi:threonine aldolase
MVELPIDLRSDTVTRPTTAMRAVMAAADVGDDQYGEDPSINLLQERVADLLGKEAALWLPTGTMANQAALRLLTRPGDDVIVSREAHSVWHEAGASGRNAGVQFTELGTGGTFTADEFRAACKPQGHFMYPGTTLVEIENTHNRAGGVVWPQAGMESVCAAARELRVASFLDGARLWNAAVAGGVVPSVVAAPFDLVSVALSKGLGAPGGSLLAGGRELIGRAQRERRMLGGAMRQAGVFGAAGLYALEHHYHRLAEDHANACLIAGVLAACRNVRLDAATVQTNILVFDLAPGAPDAAALVSLARERGVLINAFGARRVRAVTHLDVSAAQCRRAAEVLATLADGPRP